MGLFPTHRSTEGLSPLAFPNAWVHAVARWPCWVGSYWAAWACRRGCSTASTLPDISQVRFEDGKWRLKPLGSAIGTLDQPDNSAESTKVAHRNSRSKGSMATGR
jgi:hypothetical protein